MTALLVTLGPDRIGLPEEQPPHYPMLKNRSHTGSERDSVALRCRSGGLGMMGERLVMQDSLFYEFRLEEHVPTDHRLRAIDRFVDLSDLRRHLASFYSVIGRPSIDPELMIRMLIVGYCYGIRSERRLCEEVHLNLAYRWFC